MSRERRREMVDREHPGLSTVRQCALLGISRSSVYYRPRAPSQKDLALMKQIDQQYLATPFYGSRRTKVWLGRQGHWLNRKRVQRLMRTLGLQVIYRRPRTSKPAPGHKVYPYLLGGMEITGPNQVWAADITYIPMARGFLYLVASMDWYSRYVVAWRLSNTLDADFCVETLEEALSKGKPEVFNTDQGSQFTSEGFTELLEEHGVSISMDGKGRYTDNIFVERLWRTVKYEEVYLKAYSDGREAKDGLEAYFHFYNTQRPHQALGYRTPAEVFSGDSVQSDEQSKERRWPASRALVYLGKTAGPSLITLPQCCPTDGVHLKVTLEGLKDARGIAEIVSVQNQFSLSHTEDEKELLPYLTEHNIAYLPYSPLGGGGLLKDPRFLRIAQRTNLAPAQLALAWIITKWPTAIPIPGTSDLTHLDENLSAASVFLPQELVSELDALC